MVKCNGDTTLAVDGLPNKDYLKHHIYAPDGTCAEASALNQRRFVVRYYRFRYQSGRIPLRW